MTARARRAVTAVVTTALALSLGACSKVPGVYTYEAAGATAAAGSTPGASGPFDADAYVAGIWQDKVLPTLDGAAKDAATVLPAIAADATSAATTYGRASSSGGPATFVVKGSGTVVGVDTSGPQGLLEIDLAPGDGTADLGVAVGPAFLGTALRDALPFIDFSQFTNQIDYADVATALNATVKKDVVAGLDPAAAKGRKVEFVGAFSLVDPANIALVPVSLKVAP